MPRSCVYFITNVGHDSFICVTWHDSFKCLIHMCDMIHLHYQLIRIIHVCAMTHSYVNHLYECNDPFIYESFVCETWTSSQCRYLGSHSRWPNKQTHTKNKILKNNSKDSRSQWLPLWGPPQSLRHYLACNFCAPASTKERERVIHKNHEGKMNTQKIIRKKNLAHISFDFWCCHTEK